MKPVRIAVVGCGYWGSKHVRVLSQLPTVEVALVDVDHARRESLGQSFPTAGSYATLEDALPHVDATIIATRPTTHHHLAAATLAAGCHVLVEKPLATSVDDALELIALAEANRVVLMTGHTFEYNPAVWKLREIVNSDEFGEVLYVDAARLNLGLYQPDVNVLWDLAPHDISIVNFLIEQSPTEVCAWGSRHADVHEDVGYLQLRYGQSSLTANIHVSWLDPCKVRRITVVGTNQMAVYDDVASDDRIRVYDKGIERGQTEGESNPLHEQPLTYRNGAIVSPFIEFREPLQIEAEHFVDCIISGATPRSDGWSGLEVVRVLGAADASLEAGTPVSVPPVPRPSLAPLPPDDEIAVAIDSTLRDLHRPEPPTAIELVNTPASTISRGLRDELAPLGFAVTSTDSEKIVYGRRDRARITLRHRPAPLEDGVDTLLLTANGYPRSDVTAAIARALGRLGHGYHGTPDSFAMTHPGGGVVRVRELQEQPVPQRDNYEPTLGRGRDNDEPDDEAAKLRPLRPAASTSGIGPAVPGIAEPGGPR